MVGCVLAGEYSLQQAQYIFRRTNDYQKVCHFHLTDAMDQIFKKLEISTINDVFNCAKIEQVMNIVRTLRPEISKRRFEIVLYNMKNTKILHQKNTKILSSSIKATTETPKPMSNICALCNLQRQRCELNVRQINEKLIIMVGWILLDYCSIKETARFLEPGGRLVCHEHIFETIFEVFETLQIAQMKEIDMCSEGQMEKIMKIVDSLSSGINFKGFSACLREFARKNKVTNGDLKNAGLTSQFDPEKSPKIEENSEKSILQISTTRCAICQKSQNPMKIIQSQNEKLVIVVGNVLRGVVTFKKAKPILAMSDQPLNFCVSHITEAIDGIFRALQREKIDEIRDSCPYMKNVMIVVNVMRPKLSSGLFVKIFQDFVKIHSKIQ
ncbi:hypothetical protein B9Z55_021141 [Caenorhabditis nigoni]|uniref:Lin-15A/B-like domain-containing protein n=3 Tax=Caenorhabditis nigoni TaxID=1611254 RepID=A0A2G5TQP4_9PELO|nr:hypothetical protein B9Z55_021141 [Caenorhabditis nigoni]